MKQRTKVDCYGKFMLSHPVIQEMVQAAATEEEQEAAAKAAEAFLREDLPEAVFGAPNAGPGMWASCLRLMHPTQVKN